MVAFPENALIDVWRPQASTSFSSAETLVKEHTEAPAFVRRRRTHFVDTDGVQIGADGNLRIDARFRIEPDDVFRVGGESKRWRINTVDHIYDASGDVVHYKAVFSRDNTVE